MRFWQRATSILFTVSLSLAFSQETTEGLRELPLGEGAYRGQTVRYRIWEGQALVEGDILLGPVKDLIEARQAVAIAAERFRWPASLIPYELDPNLPNQDRIRLAIAAWEKTTPVRFKVHEGETDYVSILRSTTSTTCNSNVGRIGGRQTVNLGDGCSTGNTVHELGHTIGLWHTQSRIDRNHHLRVLYENIDKEQWDQYNQQLLNGVDIGPFDYGSIMLYPATGFTRNTRNSMDTIPRGIPIGQRTALSAQDILAVRSMYGEPETKITLSTVPAGLPLVVDGDVVETPRTFDWAEGEVHHVEALPRHPNGGENSRLEFAKWSDGGERGHEVVARPGMHVIANYAEWVRLRAAASPAGSGQVEVSPPSEDGFYPLGTTVFLRAVADGEAQFYRWTAGAGGATFLNANRQGNASNPAELTIRTATASYVASFTREALTTIASSVPGAQITVDGIGYFAPTAFLWPAGSSHTVSVLERTLLPSNTSRLVFDGWSNGGERTQEIVAGAAGVLTAKVRAQHQVVTRVVSTRLVGTSSPNAARNLGLEPQSADGFYDEGTELTVSAEGPDGVPFAHWYGDLGSEMNPQRIRVSEQTVVGANFVSPGLFSAQAVVNDASRQPGPVASGGVFTIYGSAIGPEGSGGAGYAVRVGGADAELLALGRNSIRFRAPAIADVAAVTVDLVRPQGTTRRTLGVQDAAPGLYTVSRAGIGQVDARNGDGSRNRREAPAARGGTLGLRLTGIANEGDLEVSIGGVAVEILELREGAAAGEYEVTVRLPDVCPAGEEVPVAVWSQGVRSQYGVWASVQ
ncbi:MAG: M12 family metallopeptidase [Bryobacteraceae bacterium]